MSIAQAQKVNQLERQVEQLINAFRVLSAAMDEATHRIRELEAWKSERETLRLRK